MSTLQARPRTANREERRETIISHALNCLLERGYTRTSLRDIAAASGMSLGLLHYYFDNRAELIVCVVMRYMERFSANLDQVLRQADSVESLRDHAINSLGDTLRDSARTHRLWYELRVEALFDPLLREPARAIEARLRDFTLRVVTQLAQLMGSPKTGLEAEADLVYLTADALFLRALQEELRDPAQAREQLRTGLMTVFEVVTARLAR